MIGSKSCWIRQLLLHVSDPWNPNIKLAIRCTAHSAPVKRQLFLEEKNGDHSSQTCWALMLQIYNCSQVIFTISSLKSNVITMHNLDKSCTCSSIEHASRESRFTGWFKLKLYSIHMRKRSPSRYGKKITKIYKRHISQRSPNLPNLINVSKGKRRLSASLAKLRAYTPGIRTDDKTPQKLTDGEDPVSYQIVIRYFRQQAITEGVSLAWQWVSPSPSSK
jgi:hypothetical protein